ncbi:MAG TPA: M67 family metallopeptidase [Candidatus Limnocylindria bacterium]|nr:M67 family metallopeptidase [Candidatus Limnocylindria bacterium]
MSPETEADRLRIGPTESEQIRTHLARAYPEEGCGVLLGRDQASERRVERVVGFENQRADSRHNRYLIAPEQFLGAEQQARAAGLDVVGFFHSHPDHPAQPSAFDLEHAWPYYSYLIVSVEKGRIADARSWRLREDRARFEPEHLEWSPEPAGEHTKVETGGGVRPPRAPNGQGE